MFSPIIPIGTVPLTFAFNSLVAAALGPLANVLSIAALVTSWRLDLVNDKGHLVSQLIGTPISDPRL